MRETGILLPVSALNSKYGIGSFSKEAYKFIDWMKEAGQGYWQILPMGPTSFGDSPYQSFSSFAGNPYYIDLDTLVEEGLLNVDDCLVDFGKDERMVDYSKIYNNRIPLLKKSFLRFKKDESYYSFLSKNAFWIDDYALFMTIKEENGGKSWQYWDKDYKNREKEAIKKIREKYSDKIEFWKYLQYKFFQGWNKLKSYANKQGIKIIGDIPIYTALDSADVWSLPELFQLDENKTPTSVAGCPPDGFSEKGQLWGNPLYKWETHQRSNYDWWKKRIRNAFEMYDVLRIDHFRGFDEYYSINYGDPDATNGKWEKGPKNELFLEIKRSEGEKSIIAEDLGFMTDSVKELLKKTSFPGMRVFQFGFDARDTGAQSDYLPHNYIKNCVAYTGTHDNPTIVSWFFEITEEERKMVRAYLCDEYTPDSEINKPIIGAVMRSQASLVIIPLQDYLGYDSRARINTPSTQAGNWLWRISKNDLNDELKEYILKITSITGRKNKKAI
ncbi:MAG: 4-alpha-glucanotransferase [Clostridia bacterium]|nr:4-alpha-glucanotransferase [Clostridia bacterium]